MIKLYDDLIAVARHRLVYAVVHDFLHQMMHPARIGRADIHPGADAHRFQPFQHLDLVRPVFPLYGRIHRALFKFHRFIGLAFLFFQNFVFLVFHLVHKVHFTSRLLSPPAFVA